jgi:hypothetical protein
MLVQHEQVSESLWCVQFSADFAYCTVLAAAFRNPILAVFDVLFNNRNLVLEHQQKTDIIRKLFKRSSIRTSIYLYPRNYDVKKN